MRDTAGPAVLIDTHCHLDFDAFDGDRGEVIARAADAGVSMMINPSVDLKNSVNVIALAETYDELFAAVGVHPNESSGWSDGSAGELRALAHRAKVVAIGEIGLDYHWNEEPRERQQNVFWTQLELAAELNLPVIVHNRESSEDTLRILMEWQETLMRADSPIKDRPGVLHSFSGDREMAEKAIAAHYFIGLTGPLTFKNAKSLQEIAATLPLAQLLIETDSPFLAPHPERGQRNEPAKVKLVAEKLAELKGLSFEEVAMATTANAQRLFGFEDRK